MPVKIYFARGLNETQSTHHSWLALIWIWPGRHLHCQSRTNLATGVISIALYLTDKGLAHRASVTSSTKNVYIKPQDHSGVRAIPHYQSHPIRPHYQSHPIRPHYQSNQIWPHYQSHPIWPHYQSNQIWPRHHSIAVGTVRASLAEGAVRRCHVNLISDN